VKKKATKRISRVEAAKIAKAKKERDAFSAGVYQALLRAQETARKTARMHGTPIYFWKNGKVVAEKP